VLLIIVPQAASVRSVIVPTQVLFTLDCSKLVHHLIGRYLYNAYRGKSECYQEVFSKNWTRNRSENKSYVSGL